MSESKDYINKNELKDIFYLSDSVIRDYLRDGVLPMPQMLDGQMLYDRKEILRRIGVPHDTKEGFITSSQAAKLLGLPSPLSIGSYCLRHHIPFYQFRKRKGSQLFFLKSEVKAALKYKNRWYGASFWGVVTRTEFLRDIFQTISEDELPPSDVFRQMIVEGKSAQKIAAQRNLTSERVRQLLISSCKRILAKAQQNKQNILRYKELAEKYDQALKEIEYYRGVSNLTEKMESEKAKGNISALDISVRALNLLNRMEIKTLGELASCTRNFVAKHRNTGIKTMAELDELLEKHGLSWAKADGFELPPTYNKISI